VNVDTDSDRAGQLIGGRYEIVGLIEKGGQGSVYRARDLVGWREVAIKVLNDTVAHLPEWQERMRREAHALGRLANTAAVRVLEEQRTDDGAPCLVMELLEGLDLEHYLHMGESTGGRLPLEYLFTLLDPIIATLEVAHELGITHRDVKPANIFVVDGTRGGGMRLLDFGFVKVHSLQPVTEFGFVAGSPSYIAPEAWAGDPQKLDPRIDIYSSAAVVFRALAGRPPFVAEDVREMLELATTAERPSLFALRPDLPPEIDDWVHQSLAIEPDDRFFKIRAMWNALKQTLRMEG
jgi:eukaryotic-like serine/threonine-protein kinase